MAYFISTFASILFSLWLITDYLHGTVHSALHATLFIANFVRFNMENDNLGAVPLRYTKNYSICLQDLDLIVKNLEIIQWDLNFSDGTYKSTTRNYVL
jgi:hypothetical protein